LTCALFDSRKSDKSDVVSLFATEVGTLVPWM
jgi:hypothetical protein